MNLKQMTIYMVLIAVAAAMPLAAAAEMAGTPAEQTAIDQSPQPASEPVEPAVKAQTPANASGSPVPSQEKKSWWKDMMYKVGLGNDPHPGETVVQVPDEKRDSDSDYVIGPGDQIGISVWRDENLSRTVVVLPDGKISFPLVGEIIAGGKTVAQLKQELESKLARYIADTGVTVEVKQSNSMIIYIVGRVNAPGRQILLANTNVLQALAMVGGPNPFADKSGIKIFRKENGKTIMFPFNYDDVSEGRHLETNIELKRGDVIIVP